MTVDLTLDGRTFWEWWEHMKRNRQEHCHAGRDGDCNWKECPQEANNRANWKDVCPLAEDEDDEDDLR
jgi:hypothetical protein